MCQARGIQLVVGEHALEAFLSDADFAAHPDWCGLRGGSRVKTAAVEIPEAPHLNGELSVQPCYANEALRDVLPDRIAAFVEEYPEVAIFSLWSHDGVNNWCQCGECLQKTPYEQILSVALLLEQKLPEHAPIEILAYSNMLNLPQRELPANQRISTLFCPYLRPFVHRVHDSYDRPLVTATRYPAPDRINPVDDREYGILFQKWLQVHGGQGEWLGVFEYGNPFPDETRRTNRGRYHYHPDLQLRADEMKYYVEHGVKTFYLCAVFNLWPDALHWWATAKLMWDPYHSVSGLKSHYYQAACGVDAPVIEKHVATIAEQLSAETTPDEALREFAAFLNADGERSWNRRYRVWLEYIALGRQSREAEVAGDFVKAHTCERQIQKLLEKHGNALQEYVSLDYLEMICKKYAETFQLKIESSAETSLLFY